MKSIIKIKELKEIITVIKEVYGIDFFNNTFFSLHRRFELGFLEYNIKDTNSFINIIKTNPDYLDEFISNISINETEMFRDSTLWIELRDSILPEIAKKNNPSIWIPDATSGEELFSLLITLHEINLLEKFNIIVTSKSDYNINTLKKGKIESIKNLDLSEINYTHFLGKNKITDYFKYSSKNGEFSESLLKKVTFKKHYFPDKCVLRDQDLVLFRNKMLNYYKTFQNKVLSVIYESTAHKGYLICGIKESIENTYGNSKFKIINESERIYKKF